MRRYCVVGVIQAQGSCRACYFCCGGGGSCVFYEVYERDQSARATNKARWVSGGICISCCSFFYTAFWFLFLCVICAINRLIKLWCHVLQNISRAEIIDPWRISFRVTNLVDSVYRVTESSYLVRLGEPRPAWVKFSRRTVFGKDNLAWDRHMDRRSFGCFYFHLQWGKLRNPKNYFVRQELHWSIRQHLWED